MATENLNIEQRNVQTASFDVLNRVLTVPVLDKNISPQLYDLFMGHEVGHALYTPLDGMKKAKESKLNMAVVNIVEDSRIERKIKYKYPGLKNSFIKAYNELVDRNFFGTQGIDLNGLNFIDRINMHCKGGAALAIKFNEVEREFLNEVETTETYEDVVDVSKRIIEYMEMQAAEEEKQKKLFVSSDDEEENEDGDFDSDDLEADDFDYDDADEGEDYEKDSDEDLKSDKSNASGKDHTRNSGQNKEEIRSYTDDSYRKNENRLFADNGDTYAYVNLPSVDLNKLIFDHKEIYKLYKQDGHRTDLKTFMKIRKETNKVVSYLAKEFEMRKNADQLKRASVAKTGDLNLNRIFSYQFSEDIFKKITVVPGGKSHGLVMFLDWSGSMAEHLENTMKQLFNLVMFCKKVNIPYEVYIFIESTIHEKTYYHQNKPGDMSLDSFAIMNILSSRMTASEFTYAASALTAMSRTPRWAPYWMSLSGTPLNEAVISAMEIVPWFQKKYKLQMVNTIFLTDGEGGILRNVTDPLGRRMDARYNGSTKAKYLVIRDTKTKQQETFNLDDGNPLEFTSALVKLLKRKTNTNVIGFYVISLRDFKRRTHIFWPKGYNTDAEIEKFRKEKYTILTNTGYDDYYLLRSNGMDTEENSQLVVKENATTRGLVSAFSKYTGSRVSNRVILNRFIGLIT
jgi:hypothetical protein